MATPFQSAMNTTPAKLGKPRRPLAATAAGQATTPAPVKGVDNRAKPALTGRAREIAGGWQPQPLGPPPAGLVDASQSAAPVLPSAPDPTVYRPATIDASKYPRAAGIGPYSKNWVDQAQRQAAPAGLASGAITGQAAPVDPISAGLAAMDRRFGPGAGAIPVAFPPGTNSAATAPSLYGPVAGSLPVPPPVPLSAEAAFAEGQALGARNPAIRQQIATRSWEDESRAMGEADRAASREREAQRNAGNEQLRNQDRLRGMPAGTTVGRLGEIVAAHRAPAADVTRQSSIPSATHGAPDMFKVDTQWRDDGRNAPTVVGGAGHRVLRPVDPVLEANMNRDIKERVQTASLEGYGGVKQRQAAMDKARSKRADFLANEGQYENAGRKEQIARRQARRDKIAQREQYKGDNRLDRLEARRRGPTLEEMAFSNMDPRTQASYMVGQSKNRAEIDANGPRNRLYNAEAAKAENEAATGAAIGAKLAGGAAGAVTGAPASPAAGTDALGLPPGTSAYRGLAGKPLDARMKPALEAWASTYKAQATSGFWHGLGAAAGGLVGGTHGEDAEKDNALAQAVKLKDWKEVNRILSTTPTAPQPAQPTPGGRTPPWLGGSAGY